MGTYVHFTQEQKQRANSVDLEGFLRRQGETLLASGRENRLKSDPALQFWETSGLAMQHKRVGLLLILFTERLFLMR